MSFGWPSQATYIPGGWAPPPPPQRRRRGLLAWAVILHVAAAGVFGFLAYRDNQAADKWRRLDQAQTAATRRITGQLQTANSRIDALNRQLTTLNGQIGTLQNQLSSVANQKEKAVDQETVLHQLLSSAGSVASYLQQCISATGKFQSDLNGALVIGAGTLDRLSTLQSEGNQVAQICSQAELANQNLQTAIEGDS